MGDQFEAIAIDATDQSIIASQSRAAFSATASSTG